MDILNIQKMISGKQFMTIILMVTVKEKIEESWLFFATWYREKKTKKKSCEVKLYLPYQIRELWIENYYQ